MKQKSYKMNQLTLKNLNVQELDIKEMNATVGGNWYWVAIEFALEHGEEIYNGFSDGWNGRPKSQ